MKATLDDHSFGRPVDPCSEWFDRALRGDEGAAARLYHHCLPRLSRWLSTRLSDSSAEEAAHDALALAFEKGRSFRPGTLFFPWLRSIAWRRALHSMRDKGREESRIHAWMVLQTLVDEAGEAEDTEQKIACLKQCLRALPESLRQLVSRRYMEGRSSQAIADELGQKRSAVAVRLMRARQRLRHDLTYRHGLTGFFANP